MQARRQSPREGDQARGEDERGRFVGAVFQEECGPHALGVIPPLSFPRLHALLTSFPFLVASMFVPTTSLCSTYFLLKPFLLASYFLSEWAWQA